LVRICGDGKRMVSYTRQGVYEAHPRTVREGVRGRYEGWPNQDSLGRRHVFSGPVSALGERRRSVSGS
jgi:hypothetical protein